MKHTTRFLQSILCCLLLALLPAMALAAPADTGVLLQDVQARSLAWDGGALYLLGTTPEGENAVFTWTPGQQEADMLCLLPATPEGLLYDRTYQDLSPAEKEQVDGTVSAVFIHQGQLHGMNHYSGRFGPIAESGVAWREDLTLDLTAYQRQGIMEADMQPFTQDNRLIMPLRAIDYTDGLDGIRVAVTDLDTGKTRVMDTDRVLVVAPYKPGALLALQAFRADDVTSVWRMAEMDIETGKLTPLPMAMPEAEPYADSPSAIGYDAASDSFFYALPQRLMVSRERAPFKLAALLPFDYLAQEAAQGFVLPDRQVGIWQFGLFVGSLTGEVDLSKALTIQAPNIAPEAIAAFKTKYPDITVLMDNRSLDGGQIGQMIAGGDADTDLFTLQADASLRALINKGYAHPLDSAALIRETEGFYPHIRNAIDNAQGQPCAWPANLFWSFWQVDTQQWAQYMGDRPLPATWIDVLTAMRDFSRQENLNQPEAFFLFETTHEQLVQEVLYSYIRQYETPDAPMTFDVPALRQALDLLREIQALQQAAGFHAQQIIGTNIADEDILPALLHPYAGGGNLFAPPSSGIQQYQDLPSLTFDEGGKPAIPAYLYVHVVNPNSPRKDLAQAFLQATDSKEVNDRLYYALRPHENEPWPNPHFAETLAWMEDNLAQAKERLAKAREDGATGQQTRQEEEYIAYLEYQLANQDELRYSISPAGIENYRSKAEDAWFPYCSLLLASSQATDQIDALCARFAAGALDTDAMAQELNQIARLVFLEQ
jgi:hypothetical protein